MSSTAPRVRHTIFDSGSSGLERKLDGQYHLRLNMVSKPIANKYHEGKMKRTLKRELKVPELAERKADGTTIAWRDCCAPQRLPVERAQAAWWVLIWQRAMLLALCVTDCSSARIPLGTCQRAFGSANVPSSTRLRTVPSPQIALLSASVRACARLPVAPL